ncbi:hypothetical protein [Bacillus sp. FJAT-26390]|uniref:hypothetical protein n=1 Tax=Bacillus sp. FJAT-26390 TaxID=1743142 RepID=UPI000807C02F|nr:hypothetical protein [Bacillus sp. FJAT-26390]OBZ13789.1 hypothetical protein A7975_13370 [Bacillus sp. FJAT-26390]
MNYKMKKFSLVTISLCLLLALVVHLPVSNAQESVTKKMDNGIIFKSLAADKLPEPKIKDEKLKKARVNTLMQEAHRIWADENNMSAVNDFLRANGCIILTPEKSKVIGNVSSLQDDVTMGLPGIAYETWSGYYIITGTMQWKKIGTTTNPRWMNDFDGGAGDADVVLLSIGDGQNANFKNKGYSLSIKNKNGVSVHVPNAESWDKSGVIWRPQDQFTSDVNGLNKNYNLDSYFATLSLEVIGGTAVNLPVFNQYGHTWKKTAISGFGFFSNGLTLSYADSSYGWKAISGPKYYN